MYQVTIEVNGDLRFAQVVANADAAYTVEYTNAVRLETENPGATVKGRVRKA